VNDEQRPAHVRLIDVSEGAEHRIGHGLRRNFVRIPDNGDTKVRSKRKPKDIGESEIAGDESPTLVYTAREDDVVRSTPEADLAHVTRFDTV
jgi:hypothetical protein